MLQKLVLKYGPNVEKFEDYQNGKYVNAKTIVLGPRRVSVGIRFSVRKTFDFTLTVTYSDTTLTKLSEAERGSVVRAVDDADGL